MNEDGSRNAAATHGVKAVFNGDIVVYVNGVHFDAVVDRVAHCVVKVHAVAGIVLDDEKNALVRRAFLDRVIDLYLRRGREHVAANRGVQHTFSYETCVSGFVTRAASGDQADFIVVYFLLFYDFEFLHKFKLRMRHRKTVAHIVNKGFGGIHYFLHNYLLYDISRG